MELFFLLEVGIELSETLQREFIGESDEFGVWHVFLLEISDLNWISCTVHEDLLLRVQ